MPWREVSTVSLRKEFTAFAALEDANVRELCRRFGISPTTGYKWLSRYRQQGEAGLNDLSRRPHRSPARTPAALEQAVLGEREAHPAWGGRKLRQRLLAQGWLAVPSASTITAILQRHGRLAEAPKRREPWQRFEKGAPNELWQMDFKGHFQLLAGRCHPLTVVDDHSRYALGLEACDDERRETVQARLTAIFRHYGLPQRMLMDNGHPWRGDARQPYTALTLWLMRLGVAVGHGRVGHPQTQGKNERFNRTLKAELLAGRTFADLEQCQRHFDRWRDVYNFERPHQALGMATPASRYLMSPRTFPETLPAIEYGESDAVRKVQAKGELHFRGRIFVISRAFRGYPVAVRPTSEDGRFEVFFCAHKIATLDLDEAERP